ncbi:MAG: response regulator [Archangium sp.]|nr:response regulator [Archangium sp.]
MATNEPSSDAWYRTLLELSPDVLYTLDASFHVQFWSPGATHALGWTAQETRGAFGPDFIHPDDLAVITTPMPGDADLLHLSYRVRHKNGSYRTLDAMVRNLLEDPAVGCIVINARDVTEQRAFEAKVAETSKLDSIGRLAGGVAHDFNNLLTIILSCGAMLEESAQAGRPADLEDVEGILSAADRARKLTQQLLAFARRQVTAPVVVELDALVKDSERMLSRLLGEDVRLTTRLGQGVPRVHLDPSQLQQVIINLAVNARDAMPKGGTLEVATAAVELSASQLPSGARPGRYACLTVRDDGAGLSEEARAHLFEPFFTTKALGRGTGLGLAMVHGVVSQAGGLISVDSAPGRGTTFTLLFPGTNEALAVTAPRPRGSATSGGETVLLVEDDAQLGTVTARILRDAGYRVVRAHDGNEALNLSHKEPRIDVLLTDVVMPGLGGEEVATQVCRHHPETHVLFVSGYPHETLARHTVSDGGLHFLSKPYSGPELLERLKLLTTELARAS